jgi:hypothetical protein
MNTIKRTTLTAIAILFAWVGWCQTPPILRTEFTTNTAVGAINVTGTITNYYKHEVFASNFVSNTFLFSLDGLTNQAGLGALGYDNGVAIGNIASGYTYGTSVGSHSTGSVYGVSVGYNSVGSDNGVAIGVNSIGTNLGVSVGFNSSGSVHGVAVGRASVGTNYGVAIGEDSKGSDSGVAVGNLSYGFNFGVAVGSSTQGSTNGVSIGSNSDGSNDGTSVGSSSTGFDYGAALGEGAHGEGLGSAVGLSSHGEFSGVSIGVNSIGYNLGVGIGSLADGHGTNNVAIGANSLIPNTWTNTVELGAGTATLPGGLNFHGYGIVDSNGVFVGNGGGITNIGTNILVRSNLVLIKVGSVNTLMVTNGLVGINRTPDGYAFDLSGAFRLSSYLTSFYAGNSSSYAGDNGALGLTGGSSIAKDLWVGGHLNILSNLNVGGTIRATNSITQTSTTASNYFAGNVWGPYPTNYNGTNWAPLTTNIPAGVSPKGLFAYKGTATQATNNFGANGYTNLLTAQIWDRVLTNGFTASTNGNIAITNLYAGFYMVDCSVSILTDNTTKANVVEGELFLNEVNQELISEIRSLPPSAADYGVIRAQGLMYIPANTGITFRLKNNTTTGPMVINRAHIMVISQ